jgi:uncharacterized protein (DUF608 family)
MIMKNKLSNLMLALALLGAYEVRAQQILQPTADMVDVTGKLGIPIGGIGSGFSVFGKYGFVEVYFDTQRFNSGQNGDWKVTQAPRRAPDFALQLTEGDTNIVLQETPVAWLTNAAPVDTVHAFAYLPKSYFAFEKTGLDLQINMTAFSPMIPHDLTNSTIPVQIFDITVKNIGTKSRKFSLALVDENMMKVQGKFAVFEDKTGSYAFGSDDGKANSQGVSESLKLGAGKSRTIRFYIGWNYPVVTTASSAMKEKYRHLYAARFSDAMQPIELAKKSADKWSAAIDEWHAAYNVPPQFKRIWFSSLSSVITSTVLTDDPYFFEREMPHGWMNTMDVTVYNNWLYMINWPELERMDMNQFFKVIPTTGDKAGFVYHSLWNDGSDYAEEPTFMGRVYRDSLWFNDSAWTTKAFPLVELAANRAYRADNYEYLLHTMHGNQSYDLWMMPGVNSYVNVMWIYGLYGLEQMSQNLHQPVTVGGLPVSEMLAKATQSLDNLLWNTNGYWNTFYVPTNRPEEPKSFTKTDGQDTFSDQLFGRWMTLIDPNAGNVLPAEKITSALETVYSNNLIDDKARGYRGWANGMRPGHLPEMKAGSHARDCWFGPQAALASLFANNGDEAKSLDVFNSLEASLHGNDLYVGEWNQSVAPDGMSRVQPEEPAKDTPRFPPYPRYKCGWEYLVAILGLKMDANNFYLKPFQTIDFTLTDVELAGTHFTIQVQSGWTKVLLDGKPATLPVTVPRSEKSCQIDFIR